MNSKKIANLEIELSNLENEYMATTCKEEKARIAEEMEVLTEMIDELSK